MNISDTTRLIRQDATMATQLLYKLRLNAAAQNVNIEEGSEFATIFAQMETRLESIYNLAQ